MTRAVRVHPACFMRRSIRMGLFNGASLEIDDGAGARGFHGLKHEAVALVGLFETDGNVVAGGEGFGNGAHEGLLSFVEHGA